MTPTKGLTLRNGKREANVHDVKDGVVFYGVYLDGDDWPAGLYQAPLDEWERLATQAIEHGAEVFTTVRPREPRRATRTGNLSVKQVNGARVTTHTLRG